MTYILSVKRFNLTKQTIKENKGIKVGKTLRKSQPNF